MEWLLIAYVRYSLYSSQIITQTFPNYAACQLARREVLEMTEDRTSKAKCVSYKDTHWREGFDPDAPKVK